MFLLSLASKNLKHVLAFVVFLFVCSLFFFFLPHLQLHATARVFWLWQLNAVHALRCFFLFLKSCRLMCMVYWIVPAFSAPLCSVPSAASLLMCCPLCLMRTLIVCCGFQENGKHNFYRFSVRTWQNLFFQQCLLNDSSKKMSILIFTCYITCTYL